MEDIKYCNAEDVICVNDNQVQMSPRYQTPHHLNRVGYVEPDRLSYSGRDVSPCEP